MGEYEVVIIISLRNTTIRRNEQFVEMDSPKPTELECLGPVVIHNNDQPNKQETNDYHR